MTFNEQRADKILEWISYIVIYTFCIILFIITELQIAGSKI
jgi:hypothetical protein